MKGTARRSVSAAVVWGLLGAWALSWWAAIPPVRAAEDVLGLAEPDYQDARAMWEARGIGPVEGVSVTIPATAFARYVPSLWEREDPGPSIETGIGGRPEPVLVWRTVESMLEWEVTVPRSGLYEITVDYYPLEGKRSSIQRDVRIDGEFQYVEARRVFFERAFRDAYEPRRDNQGNDIRPPQVEVPSWMRKTIEDADGMFSEPLLFYFREGTNRLAMFAHREPMAIASITVHSPARLPSHADALAGWQTRGVRPAPSDVQVWVQGEDAVLKTDPTVRREFNADPRTMPASQGHFRLNEFGGWRWRRAGQRVTWEFEVPADGLYQIGMRVWQGYEWVPSVRDVRIDGELLFDEMRELHVPFDTRWQLYRLGQEYSQDGRPFLFYLTKGRHTLELGVRVGAARHTVRTLLQVSREMARISREVAMVTGINPDPNMEWSLDKRLPHLVPALQALVARLTEESGYVERYVASNGRPGVLNTIGEAISQMQDMIRHPDSIPSRQEQFAATQTAIGTWVLRLQEHPLDIDWLWIASPEATPPPAASSLWDRLRASFDVFLMSFTRPHQYYAVGSEYRPDDEEGVVLELWVARGREWAAIMKEMIEDDFTPRTGIKVNVNVVPPGQLQVGFNVLLLSAAAGKAPDVATGVDPNVPVEFAIRGAVLNLNQFADYPEVAKRFRPGALIPYRYRGGDYALPETQDFTMLFYRTDILGELGLEPPDTWQDVYAMLPMLHRNGYEFYYPGEPNPWGGFVPFLFQHGGTFYTADGLRSALDTPQAYEAFREWTGLFTNYRIQKQADFYNRMRTGEMPIGISNYWTYVLLSTAAPELAGWWEMRPLPGMREPDGTVDRSTGGAGQVAMIFRETRYPRESWELIKWWTGAEVQVRFARELEALIGSEARWNTANVEALRELPWPRKDIASIEEQWQYFTETPVVLGGYFTSRHINNAWSRVVLQGWHPREALEEAVKEINRELLKKQEEFGITVPQDEPLPAVGEERQAWRR